MHRFGVSGVSAETINSDLREFWGQLRRDERFRRQMEEAGVPPSVLAAEDPPFKAEPEGEQFGIVETILIKIAVAAGTYVAKKAIDKVWDELWKRVEARRGGQLTRKDDAD